MRQFLFIIFIVIFLNNFVVYTELQNQKNDSLTELKDNEYQEAFIICVNVLMNIDTARTVIKAAYYDDKKAEILKEKYTAVQADLIPMLEKLKNKYSQDYLIYDVLEAIAYELPLLIDEYKQFAKFKNIKNIIGFIIDCAGGNILDCITNIINAKK